MTNWVDKSCKTIEWYTPEKVLERVRVLFCGRIPLDPCTSKQNPTKAETYFTEEDNGLMQQWGNHWFCNPPYGKVFPTWCKKIGEQHSQGVALLPCGARFSTRYFQDNILSSKALTCACFIRGRLSFLTLEGDVCKQNPYDSALYGFNVESSEFFKAFTPLGACWSIR